MAQDARATMSPDFKRSYKRGFVTGLPLIIAYIPFALVFGVVAVDAGLAVGEAIAMSAAVVAGAAQFAAIGLLTDGAPVAIAIVAGVAVNLRMVMYSAHIAEYWRGASFWRRATAAYVLHDQSYGMSISRYADGREPTLANKFGWYFGVLTPTTGTWFICTTIGAVLGAQIPAEWSLDFAVPIAFIAIAAPMLKRLPHVVAALVGVVASLALVWLPLGFGVLAGGVLGMLAGVLTEFWMDRRNEQEEAS